MTSQELVTSQGQVPSNVLNDVVQHTNPLRPPEAREADVEGGAQHNMEPLGGGETATIGEGVWRGAPQPTAKRSRVDQDWAISLNSTQKASPTTLLASIIL